MFPRPFLKQPYFQGRLAAHNTIRETLFLGSARPVSGQGAIGAGAVRLFSEEKQGDARGDCSIEQC
jgi:hypothetical protein